MATQAQIDQDALAAEWGLSLEAEECGEPAAQPGAAGGEEVAGEWATMVEGGDGFVPAGKGGAERILNQEKTAADTR